MSAVPSAESRLALLRESELLRDVGTEMVREIDQQMHEVRYAAGEAVFGHGDVGDAVYVILSGTLSLEVDGRALFYREPGDCVGEFALIDDEPRSTAAIALTDVILLRWERADFHASLMRDTSVARGIFRMLTGKLREGVESRVRLQIERERWQQDLARAREIQMGMLPGDEGARRGLQVAGHCRPAAEVGGDYFDYVEHPDGGLGVIIGDVTGHGFYSGLFVAMAKACVHANADAARGPGEVIAALRRTLDLSIGRQLLMTGCYVLFEPDDRRLTYANAGHPYPYHYRPATREMTRLEALDPILGALELEPGASYDEADRNWEPDDVLVLYSDGVTEARDAAGEMFGHERLEASLRGLAALDAQGIRDGILGALGGHMADVAQGDDVTLVVVKAC